MITLYQFPFSPYCEKVRWALDYKGMAFTCENLLPGLHQDVALKLASNSTVPIIVDGHTIVQDSTAIIDFLDAQDPRRLLTPEDPGQAREAMQWEAYLDEEVGQPLRLWFYFYLLPDDERAVRFLLDGAPESSKSRFVERFPVIRRIMMQRMGIDADSARVSEARLEGALARLDRTLRERAFLAGDRFSRADLTAGALLSPLWAPGKSEEEIAVAVPEPVLHFRRRHGRSRPIQWLNDMYHAYRRPPLQDATTGRG